MCLWAQGAQAGLRIRIRVFMSDPDPTFQNAPKIELVLQYLLTSSNKFLISKSYRLII